VGGFVSRDRKYRCPAGKGAKRSPEAQQGANRQKSAQFPVKKKKPRRKLENRCGPSSEGIEQLWRAGKKNRKSKGKKTPKKKTGGPQKSKKSTQLAEGSPQRGKKKKKKKKPMEVQTSQSASLSNGAGNRSLSRKQERLVEKQRGGAGIPRKRCCATWEGPRKTSPQKT